MKNNCKILSLLFFCVVVFAVCYRWFYVALPSKQEFYAKHHIEHDSIIPSDFDVGELRKIIVERYGEKLSDESVQYFVSSMAAPEQYEGFYKPQDKVLFYNAENINNLYKIGLNDGDIHDLELDKAEEERKEATLNLSDEELEKQGFYSLASSAMLVSKVGKDIYLVGFYTNCGNAGCPIDMYVRKNNKWAKRHAHLVFDFCVPDDEKLTYKCDIDGGYNNDLRTMSAPLEKLYNRYYEIYSDYVWQYLQRRK